MRVSRGSRFLGLVLALPVLASCATPPPDEPEEAFEKLGASSRTADRSEVGRLEMGDARCAATLVRPNVAVTAAGCVGADTGGRTEPASGRVVFSTRAGAVVHEVDRQITFADEVTLLRLKVAVSPHVARPIGFAASAPVPGEKVQWVGYGCARGGAAHKVGITYAWQGKDAACSAGAGGATIAGVAPALARVTPHPADARQGAAGDVTVMRELLDLQADAWAAPYLDGAVDEGAAEVFAYMEPVATPVAARMAAPAGEAAPEVGETEGLGEVLDELGVDLGTIINVGREVWQVIAENAPVVNIAYDYASALPKGVTSAEALAGFSDLQHQSWRVWGVNGFGLTVYDVTYTVVHQYGGAYDGRGRYLATVAVIPSQVDVLWGYTVDMEVSKISTLNVGSESDPVASLALELALHVRTVIKDHTSTRLFQFRGDSPDVTSTF